MLACVSCVCPAVKPDVAEPVVPLVCEPGTGVPGVVTGRLMDVATCEPLTGGCVGVWNTEFGSGLDADGRYRIAGVLKPGRYTLIASSMGYCDQRALALVQPEETLVVDFRLRPMQMDPLPRIVKGDRKRDVVVPLVYEPRDGDRGTVIGRVYDDRVGEPLVDVTIEVYGASISGDTDSDGRYQVALQPGRYTLTARSRGHFAERRLVLVSPRQSTTVDFRMRPLVFLR